VSPVMALAAGSSTRLKCASWACPVWACILSPECRTGAHVHTWKPQTRALDASIYVAWGIMEHFEARLGRIREDSAAAYL